ncbi:DUF2256 domain-containing protein [Endozoicomonas sp. SCSIO W0465]|uniref:DUF2256 domain-containing protein n=1 Tax=Endozoicomonas sp. SCSIO W0465 TaxID=2918516 RepID=UPI0020755E30|nr:DUF2256 domain-containing protein [Endozoicomonas sp. SCSIO W0465]USE36065.1 DUF2256 domain-containing protein [Endozoicomonas sp. SCSIO W0465]
MKYSRRPKTADSKVDRSAQKQCPVCHRPFSWRKKWERCWDAVRYCSRRCRSQRHRVTDEAQ